MHAIKNVPFKYMIRRRRSIFDRQDTDYLRLRMYAPLPNVGRRDGSSARMLKGVCSTSRGTW